MAQLNSAPIARIDAPTPADFLSRYVRPRRPVVLQGLSNSWPAREWTIEDLARDFGNVSVQVALTRNGSVVADPRRGVLYRRCLLRDYIATVELGVEDGYLMTRAEELPSDLTRAAPTPQYCAGAPWQVAKFWLSQPSAVSAMHRDLADNLHTQVFGSKRFTLVSPLESTCVYPKGLLSSIPNGCLTDIEAPDFDRFPKLAGVHLVVADLEPGDTIYIPRRWWHHVRTTKISFSVNHWWARGGWAVLAWSADLFKRMRGISR